PRQVAVTFVRRDADGEDGAEVRVRELIGSGPVGDRMLRRVGATGSRALSVRMRSDLRLSYAFEVLHAGADPQLLPDPVNPPPPSLDQRLAGSALVLPDATELPVDPHRATAASPEVVEHQLAS